MYGSIRSGSCECMDRLGRVVKNVDRLWCCSPLFAFSLIACSLLFICRMDADNSFNLEMRIVTPNSRAQWFSLNKVVDAELTNFEDLVRDVVDKYPPDFGEVARLFYFCNQSKVNVEVRSDQDMREMFAKSNESKCCFLTVAYNRPTSEPQIPDWDFSPPAISVEAPFTPSVHCPTRAEASNASQSATQSECAEPEYLANPNPSNEHVGVDEEGLYIDLGPQHPPPTKPHSQVCSKQRQPESCDGSDSDDSDDESLSDDDSEVEDLDDIIKDKEPEQMPDADYDKKDPPMAVGTVYSDIPSFKLALATHSVKHEYHYNIEASDTGRYRATCTAQNDGCPWRIHASTLKDGVTVKVLCMYFL